MHSQHLPLREQGSYVQLQRFAFAFRFVHSDAISFSFRNGDTMVACFGIGMPDKGRSSSYVSCSSCASLLNAVGVQNLSPPRCVLYIEMPRKEARR